MRILLSTLVNHGLIRRKKGSDSFCSKKSKALGLKKVVLRARTGIDNGKAGPAP